MAVIQMLRWAPKSKVDPLRAAGLSHLLCRRPTRRPGAELAVAAIEGQDVPMRITLRRRSSPARP
jgi:hypothetical protein